MFIKHVRQVITASGHENIQSTHRSTWQLTTESQVTTRGDCILAVNASHAACDLSPDLKRWLQAGNWIEIILTVGSSEFKGRGQGHPALSFTDDQDMVFRRSSYTCDRTVTINTTFTANTISRELVAELQKPDTQLVVELIPMS